jgi:hypothetical protein
MTLTETIDTKALFDELKSMKDDISFIKEHMFDPDSIMTNEEEKSHKQAMKELKEGKTTSLSSIKKELGI